MNKDDIVKNLTFYRWTSIESTIATDKPYEMDIDEFFDEVRQDPPYSNMNVFVVNKSINGKAAKDFLCPSMVFFDIDFHYDNEIEKNKELIKFYNDTNMKSLQGFVDLLKYDKHIISAGLSKSGCGIRGFANVQTKFYEESILYDLDYPTDMNKQIHRSNWNYLMNYLSTTYGINRERDYASKDTSAGKLSQVTYRYRRTGSFYNEDWEPLENNACVILTKDYQINNNKEIIETSFIRELYNNNKDKFKEIFYSYDGFSSLFYALRNQKDDVIVSFYDVINEIYRSDGSFRKQGHLDSPDAFLKHVKSKTTGEDLPLHRFFFKRGIYYTEVVEEDERYYDKDPKKDLLPVINDQVYKKLPKILSDLTIEYSKEKRDFLLLSFLSTISIYFNKVYSRYYEGNKIYPNIYFFGVGDSSSGKSIMKKSRYLTYELEKSQREGYKKQKAEYERFSDKEKRENSKPKEVKFVIGGDGGRASLLKYLSNNDDQILYWDTEAETMVTNKRTEWGDITPLLRAGVMNERIDKNRSGEDSIYIECPKISVCVSGTHDQILKVVGSSGVQNGTFARFLYYWWYSDMPTLEDPHKNADNSKFENYGKQLFELYETKLKHREREIFFDFTDVQKNKFNDIVLDIFKESISSNGKMADSVIKKYFLYSKKISMILTMLRFLEVNTSYDFITNKPNYNLKELDIPDVIYPSNDDFYNAIEIMKVCLSHAMSLIRTIQKDEIDIEPTKNWIELFYESLPNKFYRKDAKEIAKNFSKSDRHVNRVLTGFLNSKKIHEADEKNLFIKNK